MGKEIVINPSKLSIKDVTSFALAEASNVKITLEKQRLDKINSSHQHLLKLLESNTPIYGVTTGFGDSSFRFVDSSQSETLQSNLVSYLLCATGNNFSKQVCRAVLLSRFNSLCLGHSGVSLELIERMKMFIENDWIPVIPKEGSLGASGDLIPLAYLANAIQGDGEVYIGNDIVETSKFLKEQGITHYKLKAKEGLSLVNGTSAMTGGMIICLANIEKLLGIVEIGTSWLCLAMNGRTEPFESLVNERASSHRGQAKVAQQILSYLREQDYKVDSFEKMKSKSDLRIQERYSLRCSPQVLGPVFETLEMAQRHIDEELNTASDNPLIDEDGHLAVGGNFYGGYITHSADYLKISLANVADMIDRQVMMIVDEKSNRGLPANLAAWSELSEEERSLHHGLKGLHQATSALTSEIMAKAIPNSIFSRSAECHNQDKVSLGMSGVVQLGQLLTQMNSLASLYLICIGQALDLRKVVLKNGASLELYQALRKHVPFVVKDMSLDKQIKALKNELFKNMNLD